jgi:hypothetical protein
MVNVMLNAPAITLGETHLKAQKPFIARPPGWRLGESARGSRVQKSKDFLRGLQGAILASESFCSENSLGQLGGIFRRVLRLLESLDPKTAGFEWVEDDVRM